MRRTSDNLMLAVIVVTFVFLNGAGSATPAEDEQPAKAADSESDDQPVPLAPGEAAPEWKVSGWSDGKSRKLADFRGKVVFLDFWGVWCGPCRRSIPALKQLEKKYAEQDVVFLAVHSAGSEIEEMNKALEEESWSVPSGLDKGEGIMQGATVERYGVRGFPTVVVINREGKISYNSSQNIGVKDPEAALAKMEKLVSDAGLPWPIDKDADSPEELQRRLDVLAMYMYGLEIDRALNSKEKDAPADEKETDAEARIDALIEKAIAARDAAAKAIRRARGSGTYAVTTTDGDGSTSYRERATFRMAYDHPREHIQFRYTPRAGFEDHDCYARVVIGDGEAVYDAQFIQRIFPNRKTSTSVDAFVLRAIVGPGWLEPVCEVSCGKLIESFAVIEPLLENDPRTSLREEDGKQIVAFEAKNGRSTSEFWIDPEQDHHVVRLRVMVPERGTTPAVDVVKQWERQDGRWYVKRMTHRRMWEKDGVFDQTTVIDLSLDHFESVAELPEELFEFDALGLPDETRIRPWRGDDDQGPLVYRRNPDFDARRVEKIVGPLSEWRFGE